MDRFKGDCIMMVMEMADGAENEKSGQSMS